MKITIIPKSLSGTVHVISSKSMSHRYLIGASLANKPSVLRGLLESDDIEATRKILESFQITFKDQLVIPKKLCYDGQVLNANASGSTLRFLIPIALLQDQTVIFDGKDALPKRPLDVYEKIFKEKKIHFKYLEEAYLPLEVRGPLKPGVYHIDDMKSSQFLTGLLFALPLLEDDSKIIVNEKMSSLGYIRLTLQVLKQFGIQIKRKGNTFDIPKKQTYHSIKTTIEGDYSQAAFWIVAAIIGQKITLKNLNLKSAQGDKKILNIVTKMGAKVETFKDRIVISPSKTKGITINLDQIPDLGPILMVLASLSEGKTTFTHVERLRIKESDRIDAMYQNLSKMGADIKVNQKSVVINGVSSLKGNVEIDTFNDHRIAMACAIASIKAEGAIIIRNPAVINKSYPTFFEVFKQLGGHII